MKPCWHIREANTCERTSTQHPSRQWVAGYHVAQRIALPSQDSRMPCQPLVDVILRNFISLSSTLVLFGIHRTGIIAICRLQRMRQCRVCPLRRVPPWRWNRSMMAFPHSVANNTLPHQTERSSSQMRPAQRRSSNRSRSDRIAAIADKPGYDASNSS